MECNSLKQTNKQTGHLIVIFFLERQNKHQGDVRLVSFQRPGND